MMKWKVAGLMVVVAGAFVVFLHQVGPHPLNMVPVDIPFCSLLQNRDTFSERAFRSTVDMTLDVHGELLSDAACTDGVLTFTTSPDIGDETKEVDAELRRELASRGYASIRVSIVGVVNHQTKLENVLIGLRRLLARPAMKRKDVTIYHISIVAKDGG